MNSIDRRSFVKTAGMAGIAAAAMPRFGFAQAKGSDRIKIGLIGCGGRGTGALKNMIAADPNIEIVALADLFEGKPESCAKSVSDFCQKELGDKGKDVINPDKVKKFVGWDCADQLLAENIDVVVEATPPIFREPNFEKIVASGKHAFLEKPGAVDIMQARKMYELADEADKKGMCVVCGNQRRYDNRYQELIKRVQDGEIGEMLYGQCYWNNGGYIGAWAKGPEGTEDTLEYQIRNWWCFIWASGDHIVEQHVHNIDVLMWAFGDKRNPIDVAGLGGRSTDLEVPKFGDRFTHFAIDYDMGDGLRVASYCHQDPKTSPNVSERITGTKGVFRTDKGIVLTDLKGNVKVTPEKLKLDPYIAEHKYLFDAIRAGKQVNELRPLLHSNLVAIAGRMSTFAGKRFKYDWMLQKSNENLVPSTLDFKAKNIDLSQKNPVSVPVPGKYELV